MKLTYDPGGGVAFWEMVSKLPGYPEGVRQPIHPMIFESGALYRTSEVLRAVWADPTWPLLVVMDTTSMRRGSEDLKWLVLNTLRDAGWKIETLVIQPDRTGRLRTDMPHIEEVKRLLRPGASVLSVGSGVITDITKHACYLYRQETRRHVPFVVYQTANSVSAYTSNMAPVFIDGMMCTLDSTYPDALICDLETLRDAPREMTAAGVGDLLAAFTSLPDWYLAHCLGLDSSYSELAQRLMGPLDTVFLEMAEDIRAGSLPGMAVLAKMISLGGLAMSLPHATTPMSGYEHVMSHILDLLAEAGPRPLAQHGTQVAMATAIAAEAYQRFLTEFNPARVSIDTCYPAMETMHRCVRDAFDAIDPSGRVGEECWSDYRIKLEKWHAHRPDFEVFLADWPAIKRRLAELTAPPERIMEILRAIESPVYFEDLVPPASEEQVEFAFMNAPLTRRYLTLGDLLIFTKWDREALWQDAWAKTQAFIS